MTFFSDFQYGFRSSRSSADLLAVVSGRMAMDLKRSVHLIHPRLLTEFGMLVFFTNFSVMKFQVRYLALFLLFPVMGGFG